MLNLGKITGSLLTKHINLSNWYTVKGFVVKMTSDVVRNVTKIDYIAANENMFKDKFLKFVQQSFKQKSTRKIKFSQVL